MPLSLAGGAWPNETLGDQLLDKVGVLRKVSTSTQPARLERSRANSRRAMYKRRVRETRGFDFNLEAPRW